MLSEPTNIIIDKNTVPENYNGFFEVGKLSATDADYGDFHTFQIVTAPSEDLFSLLGGTLFAKASFDFETLNQYELTIRATDVGGLSLDAPITVQVTDVRTEDADLDGLTEEEEEDIHGSSDLMVDTDKDGYTDKIEANSGTDPANPFSPSLGILGSAVPIGGTWRHLDWFGTFESGNYPWIYHTDLGWIYPVEDVDEVLWLWLPDVGWGWASSQVFPYIYDSTGKTWLYLDAATGNLYRHNSGNWELLQ